MTPLIEPELYIKLARDLSFRLMPEMGALPMIDDDFEAQRQKVEKWLEDALKPFETEVILRVQETLGWGECEGECELSQDLKSRIARAIEVLEDE